MSSERHIVLFEIFAWCTANALQKDAVEAGDAAKACR